MIQLPTRNVFIISRSSNPAPEILDPFTSASTPIPQPSVPPPGRPGFNQPSSSYDAVLLSSGKVLLTNAYNKFIYDPVGGTWTIVSSCTEGGFKPTNEVGVSLFALLLADGSVLEYGSVLFVPGSSLIPFADIYDSTTNAKTDAKPGFSFNTGILLSNGTAVFPGGRDRNGSSTGTTMTFDPLTKAWTMNGPLNRVRTP